MNLMPSLLLLIESRHLSDGEEEPDVTNSMPTPYLPALPLGAVGMHQMFLADQRESLDAWVTAQKRTQWAHYLRP
jgi:hypothetical protein